MPTIEEIITEVLVKEGVSTDDPIDRGGRTAFGISEKSNPEAWADGKVTEEEARAIYETKYVKFPRFDQISDPHLQAQLIDYGVNSGSQLAIMELQKILGVAVDGIIGPETLEALEVNSYRIRVVNNQLAIARIKMFGRIVKKDPSQLKFIIGWLNRACEWIL